MIRRVRLWSSARAAAGPWPPQRRRTRARARVVPPLAPRALVLASAVLVAAIVVARLGQPPDSAPGSPPRQSVLALLETVRVVDAREPVPGYDRECSGASACVFGPAWSDTTEAPGSGNGCSTRHDVLARDLRGGTPVTGSPCERDGGVLVDPYTGRTVDVGVTGLRGIHVDHVYPLSAAWDLGAWAWSPSRRAAFANDVDHNLLAVTAAVNTGKSDSTPADWLPPDPTRHCFYASRYLTAATAYGLPVTRSDHEALADAARRCPAGR